MLPTSGATACTPKSLRVWHKISVSLPSSRGDGVIPLPMECVSSQVDLPHLFLRDLDPRGIDTLIKFACDLQTRLGRRRCNQIDDRLVTDQRLASPVLADEREEPMLDLVPLARPWRQVTHRDLQARLIRQPLQSHLPKVHPRTVAPSTIGGDQQPLGSGVVRLAHRVPGIPQVTVQPI